MVFPRRVRRTTQPFPNGAVLAHCPVGVVRDLCGTAWRFLPDGQGWKLQTTDASAAAVVFQDNGSWMVRLPQNAHLAQEASALLDAMAFAGSVAHDTHHVTFDGPTHFRFHVAQQRRADRQR
jgi:hypothetical protein